MEVLVVQEFWEEGIRRRRAGEVLQVTPEYWDLYKPFLKPLKERKSVEKR